MKKTSFLLLALFLLCLALPAQVTVTKLLTENLSDPVGLDAEHPRFSWQLLSEKRNVTQTAYISYIYSGK